MGRERVKKRGSRPPQHSHVRDVRGRDLTEGLQCPPHPFQLNPVEEDERLAGRVKGVGPSQFHWGVPKTQIVIATQAAGHLPRNEVRRALDPPFELTASPAQGIQRETR